MSDITLGAERPANAWRLRGFNDGLAGREKRPPYGDENCDAYLNGYRNGRRQALEKDGGLGLSGDDLAYLRSLVRMDVRRKQKSVDRFAAKPGQGASEAAAALDHLKEGVAFRLRVLAKLGQ
jgi:hypothetical protein